MKLQFPLAIALVLMAGCSTGGGKADDRQLPRGAQAGFNQPSLLLSKAREIQAEQGCAAAIPAYRVISSFGEGYHVAQYELGACLLSLEGKGQAETDLFRMESVFWLNRAAWAGNARAQQKLAYLLSGDPAQPMASIRPDPEQAAMWAIVYHANSARELYGLAEISPSVADHLAATLTPEEQQQAEAAAAAFQPIEMARFIPPRGERAREAAGRQGAGQRGGRRRPR